MERIKKIIALIYKRLLKLKLSNSKKIEFGPYSSFSKNTKFGGYNFLSTKSKLINSEIGFASYLGIETEIKNCKIGKFSSIGPYVKCILGNHPTDTFVSTHPSFFSTRKQSGFSFVKEQLFEEFAKPIEKGSGYTIEIGNDVWIGARVTILDGVRIGDGSIIASGALINKNIPPYSIVGGVPAKIIKMRFDEETINYLLKLKWWDKDYSWIEKNSYLFSDIKKLKKAITNE
ncbi:acetyltransferase [Croceivirga lutea]|uniref:CatB-related O-acetyltransferase n=1 Tax=Croceivirga lutea TaxID=1775167 RepID=UPI0019A9D015|nr:CatB-related O-acetyltransferase [Croceivirga lutea]GGG42508.1 acetyltransferase [Croceivirga lutea]